MTVLWRETIGRSLPELRIEPSGKRIRADLAGRTVVDTTRALLVWEPRRVVASWAVPVSDLHAALSSARSDDGTVAEEVGHDLPSISARPVLDPSIPFAMHTAPGSTVDLAIDGRTLTGAGFRPADPALTDYVVLDFAAFDEWWEEDVRNIAHPRDPFHRIDALPSSRNVRVELDGEVLAESDSPVLLFETMLPTRFYLPPGDVRVRLETTDTKSQCAYKGTATYFRVSLAGRTVEDIAWTYREPLIDATPVAGLVCFFNERVDVIVDGVTEQRPRTPWS
jgi:uncharacterized protein (DUF427 family)